MKNKWLNNLTLNEMEQAVEEYENIVDSLIDLQKTEYLGADFLLDVWQDEYANDIDQIKEILDQENQVPSPYEDYYDNVVKITMKELK